MSQETPQPLNTKPIQPMTRKQIIIVETSIILFYIPQPRAFVAVASDIIQVFVVTAAIFIPVIVLLVTIGDVSHTTSVGNQVVERVTARLAMRDQVVGVLYLYILAIFWLIFVKMICTWLDYDNFTAWLIDRPLIALSGGVVIIVLIQSAILLDSTLKYVDFLNWVDRLFKDKK